MSEISNTKWQMNYRSQDVVNLKVGFPDHGDSGAYKYKRIPAATDANWKDAPTQDGKLHFYMKSRLKKIGQQQLDFTYFRTFVTIPAKTKITGFTVTVNQADDGARVYLFNSKHPKGTYIPGHDSKLDGGPVTTDFTAEAVTGQNTIVIVQVDDAPTLTRLTEGVDISVNGVPIQTDPSLPTPVQSKYKFHWTTVPQLSKGDKGEAFADLDGRYTYRSNNPIEPFTPELLDHSEFPAVCEIPNQSTIKNSTASTNVVSFEKIIPNPVMAFSSIGNSDKELQITFGHNIEVLFQKDLVDSGSNFIKGKGGLAIVRILNNKGDIKFGYKGAVDYTNFVFGYVVPLY